MTIKKYFTVICNQCQRQTRILYKDLNLSMLPSEEQKNVMAGCIMSVDCVNIDCNNNMNITVNVKGLRSSQQRADQMNAVCECIVFGGRLGDDINPEMISRLAEAKINT